MVFSNRKLYTLSIGLSQEDTYTYYTKKKFILNFNLCGRLSYLIKIYNYYIYVILILYVIILIFIINF